MGRDGASFERFDGHSEEVLSVAFSPDGSLLADRGSEDGEILVWNLKIQMSLRALAPPHRPGDILGLRRRGRQLASGSWDQRVQIWEVGTGDYVTLETGARVNDISFDPMGTCLRWQPDNLSFGT